MRALGIVFGGAPAGVTSDSRRLRGFAAAWSDLGPVDWAVATASHRDTERFVEAWEARPGATDEVIVALEPPLAMRHRPRHDARHEHGAPKLPDVVAHLDPTVSRDQVAALLHEERYDVVWCADPVAMGLYGRVRRDVPAILDVPDPTDPMAPSGTRAGRRPAGWWRDRAARRSAEAQVMAWHRFERYVATGAHLTTVPSAEAREVLGVPGTMVVDPAASQDVARFAEAVTTFRRWSDDVREMRRP